VDQISQIKFGPHHITDGGKFQGQEILLGIFILSHIAPFPQGVDHAERRALGQSAQFCNVAQAHGHTAPHHGLHHVQDFIRGLVGPRQFFRHDDLSRHKRIAAAPVNAGDILTQP